MMTFVDMSEAADRLPGAIREAPIGAEIVLVQDGDPVTTIHKTPDLDDPVEAAGLIRRIEAIVDIIRIGQEVAASMPPKVKVRELIRKARRR